MKRISVYINPRASHAGPAYWEKEIKRRLFRSQLVFRYPKNLDELKKTLQQDLAEGIEALICVGGDGTVHTLAQHLANQNIPLLIIPAGTANDLAAEISPSSSLDFLFFAIRESEFKSIDLIKINDRYMVTNGGLGLGSLVAGRINSLRGIFPPFKDIMKYSGKNIYLCFLAGELMRPSLKYYDLHIESDSFMGKVRTPIVLINNQSLLGGTFRAAPDTVNTDGNFNVTIFTHTNRVQLVKCMIDVAGGKIPKNDRNFITFETNKITLSSQNPRDILHFFGDGEIFTPAGKLEITIFQKAFKVFCPHLTLSSPSSALDLEVMV